MPAVRQPEPTRQGRQLSSLTPLHPKAADGFLLQPAVLHAAMHTCGSCVQGGPPVPAGLLAACLPSEATPVGFVAWADGGAAAACVPATSGSLAASLQGLHYHAAQQLQPLLATVQPVNAAGLFYELEWQAAMRAEAAVLAPVQTHLAPAQPSGRCTAALGLSQAAGLAAADVVQVLQGSRASALQALVLRSASSVPALPMPGATQPAVEAAAIAGVLKCLPYELPSLACQLLDEDLQAACTAASSGGRAHTLSTSPLPPALQADLCGVAVRGGALHRPLLCYTAAAPASQDSSRSGRHAAVGAGLPSRGTVAVTGGLGGLGLLTASWMAGGGAAALVLLSRTGLATANTGASSVTHSLSLVSMAKCDSSTSEDASCLVRLAWAQAWPLAGIMHTAGVQVSVHLVPPPRSFLAHHALYAGALTICLTTFHTLICIAG